MDSRRTRRISAEGSDKVHGSVHEFHESATFVGIWTIVILVGVHALTYMGPILKPVLWAFFLMMGLLPLTDMIETSLVKSLRLCAPCRQTVLSHFNYSRRRLPGFKVLPTHSDDECQTESGSSSAEEMESNEKHAGCGCARVTAVLITIILFVGSFVFLFAMIYTSAVHMRDNWAHYEEGAARCRKSFISVQNNVPDQLMVLVTEHFTDNALAAIEKGTSLILGILADSFSGILFDTVTVLLYMMFWLCAPMHVAEGVTNIMKHYILLKGAISFAYAVCIWLFLNFMNIDLAIIFGMLSFFCNFVPEVGPFFAMLLPLPLILLDARKSTPWATTGYALGGQLALKFFFGNVVEVKLIESQDDMKMHPVVILFFLAYFGFIWGPTGMLLSVPIVAVAKAGVLALPRPYRDMALIFIEGDKTAPQRFSSPQRWRDKSEVDSESLGRIQIDEDHV